MFCTSQFYMFDTISYIYKYRISYFFLMIHTFISFIKFCQSLFPLLQSRQQLLSTCQDTLSLSILIIQLSFQLLNTVSKSLFFFLLQRISTLVKQPSSHHHVDRIINSSLYIARIIRLAGKIVNKNTTDMRVLQPPVSIKQTRELARNKFKTLQLLTVTFALVVQTTSCQSSKFCDSSWQVDSWHWNAPVILHFYINIIRLAPMNQNFKEYSHHLEGSTIHIAASQTSFASFGSDGNAFTNDFKSQQCETHKIDNPDKEEITALAMDPRNMNTFAVGTRSGCVKRLWPIHKYNLKQASVMYKCDRPIKSVSFHPKGKLLGIATEEEQAFIYSILDKRVHGLQKPHQGGSIKIFFAGNYVCSLGLEGYLNVYQLKLTENGNASDDSDSQEHQINNISIQTTFIDRYKITSQAITKKYPFFNAVYAQFKGVQSENVILASGQTSLQVIELGQRSSQYRIERGIREVDQILLVEVISEGRMDFPNCIATSSASSLSIWNYTLKQKLFTMRTSQIFKGPITSIIRVISHEGPSFLFTSSNKSSTGKIYQFNNLALLNGQPIPEVQIEQPIQNQQKMAKPVEFVSRWEQQTRLSNLLPEFTQYLLEKSYQQSNGARFLFYNNIGCVIERCEGDSSTIQLELHDKSKPKRLHLDVKNRPFWLFAIKEDILAYATTNLVVFQCQRQLKENYGEWQFRWDNIEAISVGGTWVAVCSIDAVKILDYSGNELHTFCFDRKLIAFQAYEDTLAIAFHSAPPMWGCQAIKVRIYRITSESVTLERETPLPMKPNSHMKWFGFSEEGLLYCQDTKEVLRAYLFDRDQWIPMHSMQGTNDSLYIQHISGSELYAFRLEQKNGKREEPKVIPRSLPRRFQMELPTLPLSFLQKEEDLHLRRLRLRNVLLLHEKYRYQRWYKFKYSRNKNNLWYSLSRSIMSAQEIQTATTQLDMQLLDYLKKFLRRCNDRTSREFINAAQSLMLIIDRQAHFEETKESAKTLLGMKNIQKSRVYEECMVGYPKDRRQSLTKLNQINILEKMTALVNGAQI